MRPDSPYLALKLAHELYHKSPERLEEGERRHVAVIVERQLEIERRILGSANAALVVLPAASIEACFKDIRDRYPDEAGFEADLARTGLTPETLAESIERDLRVEAALEQVGTAAQPVGDIDVEIFYLQHRERFVRPETRSLRHILVTVNDDLPGSTRQAALAKIEAVHKRLLKKIDRFAEQALKYSECPTAMNGGLLGRVPRGQLYAEVDAAAFALSAGELSGIVESPLGFHLVLCEAVEPETQVPLAEVRERLREHLAADRRAAAQKAWIASLFRMG